SQMTDEQRVASGLSSDLIRLSVGLEHPDDLISALDDALAGI
ncbi:MAG: O-acetylhomoserine aminocarboxypropyltransferase/cysteine synthase, partial [Chlorobiaceae bacterium]|nr:O-acetylhomoserine aminocarboxypropyltransferase/cysteine synthase [Chlorobiaceae bacterium]NTW75211.1 O-acetylhomoserine aminocarboxypropyltransferase/cysteine synthase [Chlorobiaceae bacterium]